MNAPDKSVNNGRGPGGRFAIGHPGGPGRPRGYDFRKIVSAARGDTLEAKLVEVFDSLVAAACKGDTQAAKLVLDRICDKEAAQAGDTFDEILRRAMGVPLGAEE